MICKCIITAYFMDALGAHHTATMHRLHADKRSGAWSARDWQIHFNEEKKVLCPKLVEYGFGEAANRILSEHVQLERTLSKGYMDEVLLAQHSAFEEEVTVALMKKMKARGKLPAQLAYLVK